MSQGFYLCLHPNTQNSARVGDSTEIETAAGSTRDFGEFGSAETAIVYLSCSAVSGTSPSLTVIIEEWDAFSQLYVPVYTFPAVTGVLATPLRVVLGRGAYDTSNVKTAIGQALRVRWTVSGTSPNFTFRVGAYLISSGM